MTVLRSFRTRPGDISGAEVDRMALALAALRILAGVIWLANLTWKLPPDFGRHDPEGLLYNFQRAAQYAVIGPLKDLASDQFIPHFTVYGWLVFLIELTAGVLLTLGVATRIGAAIGTVQATVITLLVVEAPHEWLWTYVMLIVLNVLPLVVTSDARLSLSRRRW
jgi:uncharacterized membrane protein YphA (DoxX/SURF4 family)